MTKNSPRVTGRPHIGLSQSREGNQEVQRSELMQQVSSRLGDRRLVWFGTRGDDVESIADLPQFCAAFSIIAPYSQRSTIRSLALENLTGIRVDLDAHDIDEEPDAQALATMRRSILRELAEPSWVFTYRPSRLVSAICFARRDRTRYLGMFHDHQLAFEHKPWVETSVQDLGVPCIPWTYVADEEQLDTLRFLDDGPIMLRRSRSSGGTGLFRVDRADELEAHWPSGPEAFASVAPYIDGGIPVNIGATVWEDGVTVDLPSVQLIGIPSCTDRPFGYCGNDFGAVKDLDPIVLSRIEDYTIRIGRWLRTQGYIGTFGVDYLVQGDTPLFTEVNPRFQGSTHLSARLEVQAGRSCLVLEHLGACLGVPAPVEEPLAERVHRIPDAAHVVVHRTHRDGANLDPGPTLRGLRRGCGLSNADVLTRPTLHTDVGATMARLTFDRRLTRTGFTIDSDVDHQLVQRWESGVR